MNVTQHDPASAVQPFPGVSRQITVDKSTGAGAITMGVVLVEPGGTIRPHTHLVEEAITVVSGEALILVGDETAEIRGTASFVAPANVVHAMRNIGQTTVTLVIAYPSVEVAAFPANRDF